ncbi:hypothetical protein [Bradyrhizobium ottawaense]|uniref:hypothetical protein n=1 Tax=Bradyrhizobium ottawaense TaxID=931866 RepID=UPI0030F46075
MRVLADTVAVKSGKVCHDCQMMEALVRARLVREESASLREQGHLLREQLERNRMELRRAMLESAMLRAEAMSSRDNEPRSCQTSLPPGT